MLFVVKYFPEIIIKSKPVRKKMCRRLQDNLLAQLRPLDPQCIVKMEWDKLTVELLTDDAEAIIAAKDVLRYTSGIAYFLEVNAATFETLDDIGEGAQAVYGSQIAGRRFVVRCKRSGQHEFTSHDIERYIGGYLLQRIDTAGVDLHTPEVTVSIEVRGDMLYVVKERVQGQGGFPLGEVEPVLSLISGGFDSPVASYLTMKRGMPTHFCFFNLGGRDHELGVKEVSYYLWERFGANRRVKFIAVPFEGVVAEILEQVENSQMGVILKRMMLRAAERVGKELDVSALVTGEAIAQVSSQTLTNLAIIDSVTDTLVIRPLITADKEDIVSVSRKIGTEEFAASMPEYCGVISVKPTTKARDYRIANEEERFNFDVLDQAIADAEYINIDELGDLDTRAVDVEVFETPQPESVIIDIRHPDEQERLPLLVAGQMIEHIPFFQLHRKFAELDKGYRYLLYCDKGVMSRLHAAHLVEDGHNVAVYRPPHS
ncbi:tRNA sulfurtransferase [BD1-7 clade bacterium]|uniref:Probable tRNA sulfurtransferase n=1 Tax=BD1-7 clade bacterium TaxID=2029982 RepID=A0A5S9N116_9GAMM|nr:tRNA sulfurtransferase [BD1-7 clade bacterium]CAA0083313.1 tRNA sulfurtransferase [BD1-7 clade bacterium]